MIRIKIVEDEKEAADKLLNCIERFGKENGKTFDTSVYSSGLMFLDAYRSDADIVFMDIRLDDLDGLEISKRLREKDKSVIIIFVTNLAQFAIKGYEVEALEFIVKPLSYPSFAVKMQKAVDMVERKTEKYVLIYTDRTTVRIRSDTIKYVEIMQHNVTYHTESGDYCTNGSLTTIEKELGENFTRCSSCYLVNLAYVSSIKGNTITIGKGKDSEELPVARSRRQSFYARLVNYYGDKI